MSVEMSDLIKFCRLENKYQLLRMSLPSHTGLYKKISKIITSTNSSDVDEYCFKSPKS